MGLNIKNDETHQLIRELAEITGETQTAAVTNAVKEKLARVRRAGKPGILSARLRAIGRDCAAHLREPYKSANPDDLLYGEDGLPK
jgi:antitoxin VapB